MNADSILPLPIKQVYRLGRLHKKNEDTTEIYCCTLKTQQELRARFEQYPELRQLFPEVYARVLEGSKPLNDTMQQLVSLSHN